MIGDIKWEGARWSFRGRNGRFRTCRVKELEGAYDDPIMSESGCLGEIFNDARQRDVRDGCPRCRAEVMENASEPDVMARWGFRR